MAQPSDADRRRRSSALVRSAPPFVGRRREVDWLAQWLRDAISGRPRVVLIQGDAGIGKTRLLHEVRSLAHSLQMQVCFGRCYEDLALPYLPFVESLLPELVELAGGKQVPGSDLEVIEQLLHSGGPVGAPPGPYVSGQADRDKLRLFLAVGHGAVRLAQRCPTLFVVDDLHWADRLSLDLLDHLLSTVAETSMREAVPLVVIGTYRPIETAERLARLVARLQREEMCRSFALGGLTELDVQELLEGLGLRPSHQLTATVSEATQGNPLFIQEVLHHLVQRDALQEQGGYLVATAASPDLHLPDQVTGAIVTRAQGLSEDCRRVLTLAALVGDRFPVEVLGAVTGMPEDELLDMLEEATRQRLLRSEGRGFQFAHPLIRHVFYNEPSVARRERFHKQISESLQRFYADSPDAHLLEIAHHLVRAGAEAPADVVITFARRAADQAFGVFAWSDAARYYEAALSAAESTGRLSAEERAHLHYLAGLAHSRDQDVGPSLFHYEQAIEAYRRLGDVRGMAQALLEKTRTFTLTAIPLGALGDIQPLEEVLAALGDAEPGLRGHISAVMSEAYRNSRQAEKSKQRAGQALAIGEKLGDDNLCAYASFALALAHVNDLSVTESLDHCQRARAYARRAHDLIREGWALHRTPLPLILLGRVDEAQAVAEEACEVTRRSHDWSNHSVGLSHLACVAAVRGDVAAVEQRARETMSMASRSRYPWGGLRALLALAGARALRGAWAEAEDALALLVEPGRVFRDAGPIVEIFARVFRQLLRGQSGIPVTGTERLAADLMEVAGTDTYSLGPLCALVELGELAGTPEVVELPGQALTRAAERGVLFSSGWMFLVPRVLGQAYAAGGRWSAAGAHFQTAIDVATRAGARPELGRTYLAHARMLTAQGRPGDRPRAMELLAQASAVFRELRMHPWEHGAARLGTQLGMPLPAAAEPRSEYPDDLSEREVQVLVRLAQGRTGEEIAGDLVLGPRTIAQHVSRILEKTNAGDAASSASYARRHGLIAAEGARRSAPAPAEVEAGLRIILVSDVVASSVLIHRAGDARAHDLIRMHNALIRDCLAAHHGTEVTHTGDGVEASFTSAASAVDCAIAIQRAFAAHNEARPGEPIQVRIGINAGEPIPTEGRLFGTAVHTAFRICGRAQPGQILVSDVVRQLVAGREFALTNRGRVGLRGLPRRIQLYEVSWERRSA